MNYTLHYERLINRAPNEKPLDIYTEGHHIIPRCMGGTDEDGIVYLTPEEHYVAHQLLIKIHPNHYGLVYAAGMMCVDKSGHRINNKCFGWLKRRLSESRKGNKHSEESKRKMSNAKRGRKCPPRSEEYRRKMSDAQKRIGNRPPSGKGITGRKFTEEHKRKLSELKKGIVRSEETKRKISEAAKGNKGRVGQKLTEEHKRKISEAAKKRRNIVTA